MQFDYINLKALRELIDPEDKSIERKPFDIEVCKEDGTIVRGRVICLRTGFETDIVKVKFIESGEIRDFHATLITKYNGKEVML